MSREVRRVPVDWKHPVEHNEHWIFQRQMRQRRGDPESRMHASDQRFRALHDRSILDYYEPGEELPDESDLMPVFDEDERELGWCLYESVSEGTPVTPVFATPEALIEHLVTVGQDHDQVPMRMESAEQIVRTGFTMGSMVSVGGTVYRSDVDADLIAALPPKQAEVSLPEREVCPGDPSHYADSHAPGGMWFGVTHDS